MNNSSDGVARTASIGDNEMMTYMNFPSFQATGGSTSGNNSPDEATFLDGLFDNSGSSDNGSDKGSTQIHSLEEGKDSIHENTTMTMPQHEQSQQQPPQQPPPNQSQEVSQQQPYQEQQNALEQQRIQQQQIQQQTQLQPIATIAGTQLVPINLYHAISHPSGQQQQQQIQQHLQQQQQQQQLQLQQIQIQNQWANLQASPNQAQHSTIPDTTVSFQVTGQTNVAQILPPQTLSSPQVQGNSQSITRATVGNRKRPLTTTSMQQSTAPVSEDEDDANRRRRDRNQREQERSQRIATQIAILKDLLAKSNVSFKPDKYSTLVSVHEYIRSLQQRSSILNDEHKKLVETITKANEIVNVAQHGPQAASPAAKAAVTQVQQAVESDNVSTVVPSSDVGDATKEDELLVFVRGLDYKNIISKCRVPICICAIDGRILDANEEFAKVCGLSNEVLKAAGLVKSSEGETSLLKPISLFNILRRDDMQQVFEAMSELLKNCAGNDEQVPDSVSSGTGTDQSKDEQQSIMKSHWSGVVKQGGSTGNNVCDQAFFHFFT